MGTINEAVVHKVGNVNVNKSLRREEQTKNQENKLPPVGIEPGTSCGVL